MKIGIVGGGISGLLCAYLLDDEHEIRVFEANDYVGGHTNTVSVEVENQSWKVDTGFIVFNERTYPNFIRLLDRLGVASQDSSMSFSVRDDREGLEYNGSSLNQLFAQRSNLFKPRFHRMLRDILRFHEDAPAWLERGSPTLTMREFLGQERYSQAFVDQYLIPMTAAIWSAEPSTTLDFPMRFLIQFYHNHGMLQVRNRPIWKVVRGGSQEYVKALTKSFRERIRTQTPIVSVRRHESGVEVTTQAGETHALDRVILATHSDQTLRMLADPSDQEREILTAFRYQPNDTVLHTDASVLPRRRLAWASWNYHIPAETRSHVSVSYYMNLLQSLNAKTPMVVSLNRTPDIAPQSILRSFEYHHPIYSSASPEAQKRHDEINGVRNTYFCGAYWGYGFHEDGVRSALAVCQHFGKSL